MAQNLIKVIKQDDGYKVVFRTGIELGEFLATDEGRFDFWPGKAGYPKYWPSHILKVLASELDKLNEKWYKEKD